MRCSAYSTRHTSTCPLSPQFEGTNPFSKMARSQHDNKIMVKVSRDDNSIYKEIQQRNSRILDKIKLNFQSYQKNNNSKTKKKAIETCDRKLKEMRENIRNTNISFDEMYTDERRWIIEDIQTAQQIMELLK